MAHEPSPLKYLGAQGPQTVHLAAAIAHAVDTSDRGDRVMRRVSRELERGEGRGFAEDSRLAEAAAWAIEKAADAVRAAARHLRAQASVALGKPIRNDPLRSVLIAAAVGAVLMALLSRSAAAGARAVQRRARN